MSPTYEFKILLQLKFSKNLRQPHNVVCLWLPAGDNRAHVFSTLCIYCSSPTRFYWSHLHLYKTNLLPRSSSKISPFSQFPTPLLSDSYTRFSVFHLDHTILNEKDHIISMMPCRLSTKSGGAERARVAAQQPCLLDRTLHPSPTKWKPFVSLVIGTGGMWWEENEFLGWSRAPSQLLCSIIAPWWSNWNENNQPFMLWELN